MPIATRLTNAGTLLVNGSFDEASLSAGAISFNGSTQYLTGTSPNLSGTWTVEMWCYWTTGSTQTTIVSFNNGSNSGINLWKNSSNQLVADDGVNGVVAMSTVTPTINAWNHIAFVRVGTTTSGYVNGVLAGTTTYTPGTTSAVSVGRYNGSPFYYFPGYISNLRVVNGTAVYTAAFTPPQAILPAITNTSLLLNATTSANFIRDNSTNNYTLTNNGTATWIATGPFNQSSTTLKQRIVNPSVTGGTAVEVYNQFDEFTGAPVVNNNLMVWVDAGQTASYSGSGATWTDLSGNSKNYTLTNSPTFRSLTGGGVITFAGASSQYATTATTLFNSTTTNTYSINIWVYPTGAGQIVSVDGQSTPNTAYHYTALEITAAGLIYFGQWTGAMTTIITSARSLNAWYNLVITYNGTTATAYVNGASVGSSAIAWSAPGANTFFALMSQDATNMSGTTAYASGSIGAFSVYNRALTAAEIVQNYNALRNRYELASITATQMPVVQRQQNSGTLLINSGIFDEFTGAPVVDTGLQLWLDAAQTTSYSGSGATWTDLSGAGNNGTLTASPAFSSTTNGGTLTFNGSSQYATTTLNSATISDGTLSAWCYPITSPNAANFDGIIDGDLPGSYGTGIGINNGTYQALLNNQFWTTIGQNVTLNQWVMVSMTFTATTAIFYLNGVQVATLSYTRGAVSPGTNYLIGKSAANARYFNGGIATAMIYNRALTADEITTNFNALRGRYGI
jgi:hypothetical protein